MPRYIDVDDAIYRLNKLSYLDNQPKAIRRAAKYIDEYANEAPTADVQRVIHGEWHTKQRGYEQDDRFVCSICGEDTEDKSPYCPWCGAKNEWGD